MSKLETIEGVGPAVGARLRSAGVRGTGTLLKKGATKSGRAEIARIVGLDEGRVLKFVNHCDLMRVRGVGGEYAEILEAAGVDTVPELATRNAGNLARRMAEVNAEKRLVRLVPSEKRVADWIGQARGLGRVVTH